MEIMKRYEDSKVILTYPTHCRIEASEPSGQYYLKLADEHLLLGVLPRSLGDGLFETKSRSQRPPDIDETRTVHERYAIGGKEGRAIVWKQYDSEKKLIVLDQELFFEEPRWSVIIKLSIDNPLGESTLEKVIKSLVIKD